MKPFSEISKTEHGNILAAYQDFPVIVPHLEKLFAFSWRIARDFHPSAQGFMGAHSLSLKHYTLAVLSIIRDHYVEYDLNYRFAIESSAIAAYGLATDDWTELYKINDDGSFDAKYFKDVQKDKVYKWLNKNYKEESDIFQEDKDIINSYSAHANIGLTASSYNYETNTSHFFDELKLSDIKFHLGKISSTVLLSLHLFREIILKKKTVNLRDDFNVKYHRFLKESELIREQCKIL